jgi:hypothetical protein
VVFREMKEEHEKLRTGIVVAYSQRNQSPVLQAFLELVKKTC